MDIILLLISLAILIFLVFRGVPIFFSSVIAALFCLITAQFVTGGMSFLDGMFSTAAISDPTASRSFISGLSGYFGNFFWLFIPGALFGKLYETSGAAESIANGVVDKLGEKAIIPSIILAGFLLSYGGVSVFVCLFALYPLMLSMFKRADISRTLIPGVYFAGAGTAACWIPGSPQIQNTIPADMLGVSYSSALVPGLIGGAIQMVIVVAFVYWWLANSKKKGLHFEAREGDDAAIAAKSDKKRPNFIVSFLPMIVLLLVLNFTSVGAAASLSVGFLVAFVCFIPYLNLKEIWGTLSVGLMGGVTALFNTAAVVGFGTVVQGTPAFANIIGMVTESSGNPVIISLISIALMAGVSGSGSGALGITMPIIGEHFVPSMSTLQVEALARSAGLACLTLDSLPHNGLVVTVLNYTGNDHKRSYFGVGMITVVIPIISLLILLGVYAAFGYL